MSSQETEAPVDFDVNEEEDDDDYKIDDDCEGLLLHNGSDDSDELLFHDHSDDDLN